MGFFSLLYAFVHMFLLYNEMSVDWCAKGALFTWEDLLENPNTYATPASEVVDEDDF